MQLNPEFTLNRANVHRGLEGLSGRVIVATTAALVIVDCGFGFHSSEQRLRLGRPLVRLFA